MMDTVTRKDIARAAGVSERTVTRRERHWGIRECRSAASQRPQLYFRHQVSQALVSRRIIPAPL